MGRRRPHLILAAVAMAVGVVTGPAIAAPVDDPDDDPIEEAVDGVNDLVDTVDDAIEDLPAEVPVDVESVEVDVDTDGDTPAVRVDGEVTVGDQAVPVGELTQPLEDVLGEPTEPAPQPAPEPDRGAHPAPQLRPGSGHLANGGVVMAAGTEVMGITVPPAASRALGSFRGMLHDLEGLTVPAPRVAAAEPVEAPSGARPAEVAAQPLEPIVPASALPDLLRAISVLLLLGTFMTWRRLAVAA